MTKKCIWMKNYFIVKMLHIVNGLKWQVKAFGNSDIVDFTVMEATGLFIYGKTHFDNRYDDSPKTKYQFDSCNFHGHFWGVELTDRNSNTIINVFTVCPEKHCPRFKCNAWGQYSRHLLSWC